MLLSDIVGIVDRPARLASELARVAGGLLALRAGDEIRKAAPAIPAASIRGGNWNNGSNAGVFALNLNNAPSNSNNNIGFRCCRFSGSLNNRPEFSS